MQNDLIAYFDGEKYAGLFLAGIGAAILVAAILLFRARPDFRSFAITLIVLALAELALGLGLYLRTGPQVSALRTQLGSEPERFRAAEGARMARVQRSFVIIEVIELAIIIVFAIVAVTCKGHPTLTGIALGLVIHAALLLAFDLLAERRGAVYLSAVARSR